MHETRRVPPDPIAEAFGAVTAALWAQREALEALLFRLVEEQLVLTSGSTRWLARADEDVREAVARLRADELLRAIEVEALAQAARLPSDASLADLADALPDPWGTVLGEHRAALRTLMTEIGAVSAENRRLLSAGASAIRDTIDSLSQSLSTYNARGGTVSSSGGPLLLDQRA